jgi:hypothetical protein
MDDAALGIFALLIFFGLGCAAFVIIMILEILEDIFR